MDERERIKERTKNDKKAYIIIVIVLLLINPVSLLYLLHLFGYIYSYFRFYNDPFDHKYKKEIQTICEDIMGEDCEMSIDDTLQGYEIAVDIDVSCGSEKLSEDAVRLYQRLTAYAGSSGENPLNDKRIDLCFTVQDDLQNSCQKCYAFITMSNYCEVSGKEYFAPTECLYIRVSRNDFNDDHSASYELYPGYSALFEEYGDELVSVHLNNLTDVDPGLESKLPKLIECEITDS